MSHDSKTTPSDTSSVPDVTYVPSVSDVEESTAKCTRCKTMVTILWCKVTPNKVVGTPDAMEMMELTKRLQCCTNCGHLRLTD